MKWAQFLLPIFPATDQGRLVTPRRASGGKTNLGWGRCEGQEPAEFAPRTPNLGSPGLRRAAWMRICGRSDPKAAQRMDLPALLARLVEVQSSERGMASVDRNVGPLHSSAVPVCTSLGARGPTCLLAALHFTLRSRKGFHFTPGIGEFRSHRDCNAFLRSAETRLSQPIVSSKESRNGHWHSRSGGEGDPAR
ncbi:hypothetical protein WISP_108095 [Willisornis vidua]|uniref:Uncharacterized protein n=1 Tax=Willisornis vidua TaxID=1566151 RepID=A0ABQ9D1Q3_9PASS|nr:hypothetical protein WISP_108095 [Willisornis vidua]